MFFFEYIFFIFSIILGILLYLLSYNVILKNLTNDKNTTYECRFFPFKNTMGIFKIEFYLVSGIRSIIFYFRNEKNYISCNSSVYLIIFLLYEYYWYFLIIFSIFFIFFMYFSYILYKNGRNIDPCFFKTKENFILYKLYLKKLNLFLVVFFNFIYIIFIVLNILFTYIPSIVFSEYSFYLEYFFHFIFFLIIISIYIYLLFLLYIYIYIYKDNNDVNIIFKIIFYFLIIFFIIFFLLCFIDIPVAYAMVDENVIDHKACLYESREVVQEALKNMGVAIINDNELIICLKEEDLMDPNIVKIIDMYFEKYDNNALKYYPRYKCFCFNFKIK